MLEQNIHKFNITLHKTSLIKENLNLGLSNEKKEACGVVRVWSKESGLGPDGIGLRGFKPHTPH